ncbi:hypothetical protein WICPIJ_003240 [Wickerhamomyces pijperi]|uniref:Secreted protein n=1 Tax=Wickerhamomyces pijperi TaxID=599730 RepID=A0A9P8Q868_WICPI|nr:hypothetical protein WICPIJ_003240 [Wickerhamomyces pijperi]
MIQMQSDHILTRLSTVLMALTPVITQGNGVDVTGSVEGTCSNRSLQRWEPLQSMSGVLIPEMEATIRTSSGKGTIARVNSDGV